MFDDTADAFGQGGGRTWRLIDPRPSLRAHPYTFFVPSDGEINALEQGDLVKMMFEVTQGDETPVERMWVRFHERDPEGCIGRLDNVPYQIQGLAAGDVITFQPWHITEVQELRVDDAQDEERMFARCHVDPHVLDGTAPIQRMVRRKRRWYEPRRIARYPDTGWYIYSDRKLPARAMKYVAIGVVLNADDSPLSHLRSDFGTRLKRSAKGFKRC